MMRLRRLFVVCLVVAFSVAVGVSMYGASDSIRVGLILKNLTNAWFTQTKDGAEQAAEDLNVDLRVLNCMENPEMHLNQVEDLLQLGVDAIVAFAPSIEEGVVAAGRAQEEGVPYILLDNYHENMTLAVMTSDNILGGQLQAEYVVEQIGGEGVVVILQGKPGELSAQNRTAGNTQVYEKYPGIRVVGPYAGNWNAQTAMEIMEDVIQAEPQIDAVVANNDTMILGAIAALEAAGRVEGVVTVGWDTIPDAIDAIREGKLNASVDANAVWLGDTAVRAAVAIVNGKIGHRLPIEGVALVKQAWGLEAALIQDMEVLTANNVDLLYPED